MKSYKNIPERGDFVYQQLVGPCKTTGPALNETRSFFGLLLSKSMPFGSVRDDEGHIYSFVRSVMAPTGTPNPTRFFYQSTRIDGQHIRMDTERMAKQALTPMPTQKLDGDTVRWTSLPGEEGNPWLLEASAEHIKWVEEGLYELQGKPVGCGMQWYLPGVEWGTFYVSQLWSLSGVCEGRKVKGLMALDQVYMAEGGAIHFKKDLVVNNKMHVIWWSFATVYKDGTFDSGSFMVGHDNLGYAILNNEKGEVRTTTDIEGLAVHKDGSYFLDNARIVLDGSEEWEFLPDEKGEMADFVGGFPITAQQEGRWRRVGDTREPDHWLAWGESDRRNGSARNVRGADL
ncbi:MULTISPECIES: hypothetical protein [Pseudomonas]|jgi:hypothetical protein|uniref:AttH domain-containing protein n=1 Tax=Pseudomonas abyssi TaxID=170540 RepID=A0A2A3MDG9_9PSED|nr:hypothetical protein [Pseudomonas abyssi]PBK02841.1 hypothetical protein CNQ84_17785 [Pseudomonas abyssi]|tara:strand:- start:37764 stop:38795 length:1032 start_codon:yes stop_codon:yes gene_type:complete